MTFKIICKIKNLRHDKDLTQEDLAEKLGISRQSLINLEQGKWLPSLDLALNIANFFDQTVEEVFTDLENLEKLINEARRPSLHSGQPGEPVRSLLEQAGMEDNMPRGLMPWRPFGLSRFFDEDVDDELMTDIPLIRSSMNVPAVNVFEKGNNVIIEMQLPGIKEEDVKIEVADDHVAIMGERKQEKEDKEKNYYRKEVSYGSFTRVIPLPVKVNSDNAEAIFDNGMLSVSLPKAEQVKRKEVKIKVKKH
ncbi:MAG: hypothetical protein ACD_58C00296G0003 [uncultured bacterium]|nr:MAG: hypothetical protein ACD_58C00296G0003 [uncultured bacterium]